MILLLFRQLFVLYDSLPEPSVKRMQNVVNTAMNIVSLIYFLVSIPFLLLLVINKVSKPFEVFTVYYITSFEVHVHLL